MKFSPQASCRMRISPGPGSPTGSSTSCSTSGPPCCEIWTVRAWRVIDGLLGGWGVGSARLAQRAPARALPQHAAVDAEVERGERKRDPRLGRGRQAARVDQRAEVMVEEAAAEPGLAGAQAQHRLQDRKS